MTFPSFSQYPPGENRIFLLWYDASETESANQVPASYLNEEERQTYDSPGTFPRRKEYLYSRVLTRYCLSSLSGLRTEDLAFARGKKGKPVLRNASLHFNLSHTDGLIALSVSHFPVGIDVEKTDTVYAQRNGPLLAERYFSSAEKDYLRSQPLSLRPQTFFRIFTLKEACLKARGHGLEIPLESFTVPLFPGGVSRRGGLQFFSKNFKDNAYCLSHVMVAGNDREVSSMAGQGPRTRKPKTLYEIHEWNEETLAEELQSQAAVRN